MPNDQYTLAKFGPAYRDVGHVVDLAPAEPAIQDGITRSRYWQSLYLRLDRAILRLQRISALMSQEAEPGQMAFKFGDNAAA